MATLVTNANVVPLIYEARLLRYLEGSFVWAARTNRSYQAQLQPAGNTVRVSPFDASTVTVSDYVANPSAAMTYTPVNAGTAIDIEVDKQKTWAVKFDDIDRSLALPNLMDEATRVAADKLAEQVDADVRTEMITGTGSGPDLTLDLNSPDIENFKFAVINRLLDIARLPREGRWVIIGPYTAEYLWSAILKNSAAAAQNQQVQGVLNNGFMTRFAGIDIYVSRVFDTVSSGSVTEKVVAGTDYSCAYIQKLTRTEPIRLESSFADAMRGLYTYGVKNIEPAKLFVSDATLSNVSS